MPIDTKRAYVRHTQPPFFCLENGESEDSRTNAPLGRLDREMAPVGKEYNTALGGMQAEKRRFLFALIVAGLIFDSFAEC